MLNDETMAENAVTFICGDDDFLVSREGKSLYDTKTKDIADDFSREVIMGTAQNVGEVESIVNNLRQATQTLSMFGDKKVVWLKDVNFLADSVTGRAESTKKLLAELQDELSPLDPAGIEVIITAFPVDRRRKEFKWFQKNTDFNDLKGGGNFENFADMLRAEAQGLGTTLSSRSAEVLFSKVGGNTRLVLEEIRKLAAYIGPEGGEITEKLVTELVPNFGESDFFEAAEAFFAFDLNWTLDALRRHFFTNTDCRGIITSLQNKNRIMIQLRVLMDSGEISLGGRGFSKPSFESAARAYSRHFGGLDTKSSYNVFTQNLWYLGNKIAPTAQKLSLKKLIDFQVAFLRAFEAIISRPSEQEAVMRDLAIKCLR